MEHLGLDVWKVFVHFFLVSCGVIFCLNVGTCLASKVFSSKKWEGNHLGKFRDLGFKIRKNE